MSDDNNGSDGSEFEDAINDAIDPSDLFEKPDIDDFLDLGDFDREYYEKAWEIAPVETMTEGQLDTFVEMLVGAGTDLTDEEWDDMLDAMFEDFWDWWEENYGGG
jgi:hypothetical protein